MSSWHVRPNGVFPQDEVPIVITNLTVPCPRWTQVQEHLGRGVRHWIGLAETKGRLVPGWIRLKPAEVVPLVEVLDEPGIGRVPSQ